MRTGRTLTVFRLEIPPEKLENTPRKNWRPHPLPEKLETTPPRKIGDHPPQNIGDNPPEKSKNWRPQPPPEKLETTPPVDRHTLVKILPWPKLRFGR